MRRRHFLAGLCTGLILAVLILFGVFFFNIANLGNGARVTALIKSKALDTVSVSKLVDGAMKGMVQELQDPYSVYLEPKEFQTLETSMAGSYGGLGIYVGIPKETNRLTVMAPIKGTPAARAGVKSGDEIWKINGRDATKMDIDAAVGLMKGDAGTSVELTIKRPSSGKMLTLKMVREIIEIPSVEEKIMPGYPGVAYVSLSMFNDLTAKELGNTVNNLKKQGCRGLILDMRNNPGGSLNAAVDAGGYFVPKGKPVVWLVDKKSTEFFPSSGNLFNLPTVVLINKGSASAAEILAGAIKDVKAGTLVGETSFGKGIVQSVFALDDGAALKITTAKYLTPNKHDIHKKGIVPDVQVLLPENADPGIIYSTDPSKDVQLKRGLEVLQEKMKQ